MICLSFIFANFLLCKSILKGFLLVDGLIVRKISYLKRSRDSINIGLNEILKLTNLSENYDLSELVDSCLSKNKKKINKILNENNFNREDCVYILRIFLSKLKRLLKLYLDPNIKINVEKALASYKPPIFWKDKEITKQQIKHWKPESIKDLIYKLLDIELLIKSNLNNSLNLITDLVLEQSYSKSNN